MSVADRGREPAPDQAALHGRRGHGAGSGGRGKHLRERGKRARRRPRALRDRASRIANHHGNDVKPDYERVDEPERQRERTRLVRAVRDPGCRAALPLALLPGCKKDAPPPVQVTVQAEHPEQGPISEQITADAILAPMAQAAIAPKISAPVKKFYVERGQRVQRRRAACHA